MTMRSMLSILCALWLITAQSISLAAQEGARKVDEYGAVQCEDEMARLDNYLNEFQNSPEARIAVIVYGGRRDTRRNEVRARMARIKYYLTVARGTDARRMVILDGGFRKNFTVELWLIPASSDASSLPAPTVRPQDVRYKKGRVAKWEYDCSVLG